MIKPPIPNHPDRAIHCQEALEPLFRSLVETEPYTNWQGDESEFWPLRRDAKKAGWEPGEIDTALTALAINWRKSRFEQAKTDAAALIARKFGKPRAD
ncbi:MAG: hypothetical protein IT552_12355 [Sphingomonadaceae bacterium]|nr:hypothetical protein [Sphingomonadaceae bacterium]